MGYRRRLGVGHLTLRVIYILGTTFEFGLHFTLVPAYEIGRSANASDLFTAGVRGYLQARRSGPLVPRLATDLSFRCVFVFCIHLHSTS
jgi:hypothetical protein